MDSKSKPRYYQKDKDPILNPSVNVEKNVVKKTRLHLKRQFCKKRDVWFIKSVKNFVIFLFLHSIIRSK